MEIPHPRINSDIMQGLKVLATIVDEKARVDTKFVKVTGALNTVKVTRPRCVLSEDVEEKHSAKLEGSTDYSR